MNDIRYLGSRNSSYIWNYIICKLKLINLYIFHLYNLVSRCLSQGKNQVYRKYIKNLKQIGRICTFHYKIDTSLTIGQNSSLQWNHKSLDILFNEINKLKEGRMYNLNEDCCCKIYK